MRRLRFAGMWVFLTVATSVVIGQGQRQVVLILPSSRHLLREPIPR